MTLLTLLILDADDTADTADTALKILSSSKIESPPWRLGLCATSFNYLNIPVTDDCGPLNTLCPSREQLKMHYDSICLATAGAGRKRL
jgi:hypothetical protein